MTRERWITSAVTLGMLWLLGALVLIPQLQHDLEAAAQDALARQPALQNRVGRLSLAFDGLQARLSGSVRTPQDRAVVAGTIQNFVCAPTPLFGGLGRRLNPVGSVRDEIEVVPYPSGWLLLAATGAQARLLGSAASDYEARDLARSVQENWSAKGGSVEGLPRTDAAHHDEADDVSATLRGMPAPRETVQMALARIGQSWEEIHLRRSDEELRSRAHALGVSDDEWTLEILPVLHELRTAQREQETTAEEQRRLSTLPPGHLFIATRDTQVILRGEVGSETVKQSLLGEALEVFTSHRVHDEIRVSNQRRPTGDFGPISTALLPAMKEEPGRSCFVGFSDSAWKKVDWQIAPAEQSWKDDLPDGLKAARLLDDSILVSGWLQGDGAHQPPPPRRQLPAFLVVALFDAKAVLCGRVAEESVRTQFLAAARRTYAPHRRVLDEDVHVSGECLRTDDVLHTLKSLPVAPRADETGVFAIAVPGEDWITLPATAELVEAGGLARSTHFPKNLPASLVEEVAAEAIEQLRLHLANLKSTASR